MIKVRADEFDIGVIFVNGLCKVRRGQRRSKRRCLNIITAFDIETTNIPYPTTSEKTYYENIMYIWKWCFGEDYVVYGRTWDEFENLVKRIVDRLSTPEYVDVYLVCYVHNLSYDGHYITGILDIQSEDIFYVKPRKILTMRYKGHIEWRCSYLHSNMSLKDYGAKMKAPHQKMSGEEYDYTKARFPWTPLSELEEEYGDNDVITLVESLRIEMTHDGDTLETIPLTSTGYLRREVKKALEYKRKELRAMEPDANLYSLLRRAFRGADTHANRHYAGLVLKDVYSDDRSSSYPDVQCNEEFPIKPFQFIGNITIPEYKEFKTKGWSLVFDVEMWDVKLLDDLWGFPYISRDKCFEFKESGNLWYDNGRILHCEYLKTSLTDVDLDIILEQYDFSDIRITNVYISRYGKLPKEYTDIMRKYYIAKTELKNVKGQEIYYIKSKNKINSGYGMSAQDPGKKRIYSRYKDDQILFEEEEKSIETVLDESRPVMPYQWGVWTTAHGRKELFEMQKIVHPKGIYCDTDSVKHFDSFTEDFERYNKNRREKSITSGSIAVDTHGNTHYMGIAESEGRYDKFVTLGSKKYAVEKDGKIEITVAGVGKKKGSLELEKCGGIEAFKPGFQFIDGGGAEIEYHDKKLIDTFDYEGRTYKITRNCVIRPSTYTLGITEAYRELIEFGESGLD